GQRVKAERDLRLLATTVLTPRLGRRRRRPATLGRARPFLRPLRTRRPRPGPPRSLPPRPRRPPQRPPPRGPPRARRSAQPPLRPPARRARLPPALRAPRRTAAGRPPGCP